MIPLRQWAQVPSLIANGAMTRSPGATVLTSEPASVTTPTNSWPIRRGNVVAACPRYPCRSDPQTQLAVTVTTASVGK